MFSQRMALSMSSQNRVVVKREMIGQDHGRRLVVLVVLLLLLLLGLGGAGTADVCGLGGKGMGLYA